MQEANDGVITRAEILEIPDHVCLYSDLHPALLFHAPEFLIRRALLIAALPGAPVIPAIRTRLNGCKVLTSAKPADHFASVGADEFHRSQCVPPLRIPNTLLGMFRKLTGMLPSESLAADIRSAVWKVFAPDSVRHKRHCAHPTQCPPPRSHGLSLDSIWSQTDSTYLQLSVARAGSYFWRNAPTTRARSGSSDKEAKAARLRYGSVCDMYTEGMRFG
jgi:hypothetical protein